MSKFLHFSQNFEPPSWRTRIFFQKLFRFVNLSIDSCDVLIFSPKNSLIFSPSSLDFMTYSKKSPKTAKISLCSGGIYYFSTNAHFFSMIAHFDLQIYSFSTKFLVRHTKKRHIPIFLLISRVIVDLPFS